MRSVLLAQPGLASSCLYFHRSYFVHASTAEGGMVMQHIPDGGFDLRQYSSWILIAMDTQARRRRRLYTMKEGRKEGLLIVEVVCTEGTGLLFFSTVVSRQAEGSGATAPARTLFGDVLCLSTWAEARRSRETGRRRHPSNPCDQPLESMQPTHPTQHQGRHWSCSRSQERSGPKGHRSQLE